MTHRRPDPAANASVPPPRLAAAAAWSVVIWALVAGCASRGVPAPAAGSNVIPTAEISQAVHWVRDSAEHRAVFLQTYAAAAAALESLATGREPGTWAIATDADETVLDNSLYQKELEERGESFTPATWTAWVERRAAPPLPGAVDFLRHVHELGGRIAVVTNRGQAGCPATEDDFRRHSIPYDVILCRTDTSRKEPRWQKVEDGSATEALPPLEILMWLGDNIEDFPGLDQQVRFDPDTAFTAFGGRFVIFPNPMYGSFAANPKQ